MHEFSLLCYMPSLELFVDVPLILSCPVDHVHTGLSTAYCIYYILLDMVEARSVRLKNSCTPFVINKKV